MGNFFIDQYDLYRFVKSDPPRQAALLRQAVLAATGEDLQQDIKDACVTISEHESYDFAHEEAARLFELLDSKIGVTGEP